MTVYFSYFVKFMATTIDLLQLPIPLPSLGTIHRILLCDLQRVHVFFLGRGSGEYATLVLSQPALLDRTDYTSVQLGSSAGYSQLTITSSLSPSEHSPCSPCVLYLVSHILIYSFYAILGTMKGRTSPFLEQHKCLLSSFHLFLCSERKASPRK